MKLTFIQNKLFILSTLAGLLGFGISTGAPKNLHRWVLEMQRAQIDLLKINWGNPGFCTEWDRGCKSKK